MEKGKNKKGAVIPEVPEVWEPSPPRDDSEDDSAKYFETTKKKILSITRTKDPKRTVVSKFFDKSNKKSDSETKNEIKAKPAVKAKPKKSDKKDLEKQKSQPSIRNVINRKEETLFQKAVQNDCAETGIDPEQLQLAIAMSKSMAKEEESAEKFKNPFNSKDDKVKNFQKVLDQYGFKCKTRYTGEFFTKSISL